MRRCYVKIIIRSYQDFTLIANVTGIYQLLTLEHIHYCDVIMGTNASQIASL